MWPSRSRPRPRRRGVALLATAGLLLAACQGGGPPTAGAPGTSPQGAEPVTLNMWLFGEFGYGPLIERYHREHPNVTVKTKVADYGAHHDALTAGLASGSGAPDIAAIEVGFIAAFKARPENFYNLLDFGAGDLQGDYLPWKWQQALTGDGSALIGLPTDVGPMAMCYRTDLFEQAGLPTDREEVGALWPTWSDFIEVGRRFTQATGVGFIDAGSQLYNAIVNQGTEKYYRRDDTLVYASNPQVKKAWDLTMEAIQAGISAQIAPFTAEWNAGMQRGSFGVLTCPAWMMGYIQGQAPDTAGKWDIAPMPEGSGNWGGSFLALPRQGQHPQEAYQFISWLLAPEQQLYVFEHTGNFPSTPELYSDPAIQDFSNPFFNDAPVGRIFAESAMKVTPIYEGSQEGQIRSIVESAIGRVEQGQQSPGEAWASLLEELEREVGPSS